MIYADGVNGQFGLGYGAQLIPYPWGPNSGLFIIP